MYCGKCGKENLPGIRFCVQCGADLESLTVRGTTTPGNAPSAGGAGQPTPANSSGGTGAGLPSDASVGDKLPPHSRTSPPSDLAVTMDPSELASARQIKSGMVLSGQFRIVGEKPLGAGGMGEVWKAEDLELGTAVAIKVLPAMLARNETAVANLKKEAMIGRQLTHKSICRLYSFHSDGEIKFIVMEFVQGRTLQQVLADADGHRLPWEKLGPNARQIAEALDYAHNVTYTDSAGRSVRGVLHRDIKPGNIMVTDSGEAKLMDFGIAREIHDTMTEVTGRTSQTPLYASPEQFRGASVSPASDIYSFATVLFECLAGRRYVGAHGDIAWQVLQKPFEPAPELAGPLNAGLEAGLAKEPLARPPTAGALVAMLGGSSLPLTDTQVSATRTVAYGPGSRKPAAPPVGPTRRQLGVFLGASAVFLAAIIVIAIVLTRGGSDSTTDSSSGGGKGAGLPVGASASPSPSSPPSASASPSESPIASASASPSASPSPSPAALGKVFTNSVGMKMIRVEPGSFSMGSPPDEPGRESGETLTKVQITKPYYLGATEVTQAQWQSVLGDNPSFNKGPDLPVENVSYTKALEFCEMLSRKDGHKYRLSTEAEWEYACRAGTTTPFWTGQSLSTDQANFDGTMLDPNAPPGKDRGATAHVGAVGGPNPWGFCDMHGNVWEWCSDFYRPLPGGELTDPTGPAPSKDNKFAVLRGGSWRSKAAACRSASRNKELITQAEKHYGLRVAMEP